MADKNNKININIQQAINAQAQAKAKATKNAQPAGLKSPLSNQPKQQQNLNGILKQISSGFASLKSLLESSNKSSSSTLDKVSKNLQILVSEQKKHDQDNKGLNTSLKSLSDILSKKQPVNSFNQKEFTQLLKHYFEDINSKLSRIHQEISTSSSTQESSSESEIETILSSLKESIEQKLSELNSKLDNSQIISKIEDLSNNINSKSNEELLSQLSLINESILSLKQNNSSQDQSQIQSVLNDIKQILSSNNQSNKISKQDLDQQINKVISILSNQPKEQTSQIDTSNIQSIMSNFLEEVKENNKNLLSEISNKKLQIESSPVVSQVAKEDFVSMQQMVDNVNQIKSDVNSISSTNIQEIVKSQTITITQAIKQLNLAQSSNNEEQTEKQIQSTSQINQHINLVVQKENQNNIKEQKIIQNSSNFDQQQFSKDLNQILSQQDLLESNNQQPKEQQVIEQTQTKQQSQEVKQQNPQKKQQEGKELPKIEKSSTQQKKTSNLIISGISSQEKQVQPIIEEPEEPEFKQQKQQIVPQKTQQVQQKKVQVVSIQSSEQKDYTQNFDQVTQKLDTITSLLEENKPNSENKSLPINVSISSSQEQEIQQKPEQIQKNIENIQQTQSNQNIVINNVSSQENIEENIEQNQQPIIAENQQKQPVQIPQEENQEINVSVNTGQNKSQIVDYTDILNRTNENVVSILDLLQKEPQPEPDLQKNPVNISISSSQTEVEQAKKEVIKEKTKEVKVIKPVQQKTEQQKQQPQTQQQNKQEVKGPQIEVVPKTQKQIKSKIEITISGLNSELASGDKSQSKILSVKQTGDESKTTVSVDQKKTQQIKPTSINGVKSQAQSKQEGSIQNINLLKSKRQDLTNQTFQMIKSSSQMQNAKTIIDQTSQDISEFIQSNSQVSLLQNQEFINLCKSKSIEDLKKAQGMITAQFNRLNEQKNKPGVNQQQIKTQQITLNQIEKKLQIQIKNLQNKEVLQKKQQRLKQQIADTQLQIQKIKTTQKSQQVQKTIELPKEAQAVIDQNPIVKEAFDQFKQQLSIKPVKIKLGQQNAIEVPEFDDNQKGKSEKELKEQAYRKFTSIHSDNKLIDQHVNAYMSKRFKAVLEKHPDMSSQQIRGIGQQMVNEFNSAWEKGYVLVPTKDGSQFAQISKKEILKARNQDKDVTQLQSFLPKVQTTTEPQQEQEEDTQQMSQPQVSTQIPQQETQQAPQEQQEPTEPQEGVTYLNRSAYQQAKEEYQEDKKVYDTKKQQQQIDQQIWKAEGTDQISKLFADIKNQYVKNNVYDSISKSENPQSVNENILYKKFTSLWDSNFNNNTILYYKGQQLLKDDKDTFLSKYYKENKAQKLQQPEEPKEQDFYVQNPDQETVQALQLQKVSTQKPQPETQEPQLQQSEDEQLQLDENGNQIIKQKKTQETQEEHQQLEQSSEQQDQELEEQQEEEQEQPIFKEEPQLQPQSIKTIQEEEQPQEYPQDIEGQRQYYAMQRQENQSFSQDQVDSMAQELSKNGSTAQPLTAAKQIKKEEISSSEQPQGLQQDEQQSQQSMQKSSKTVEKEQEQTTQQNPQPIKMKNADQFQEVKKPYKSQNKSIREAQEGTDTLVKNLKTVTGVDMSGIIDSDIIGAAGDQFVNMLPKQLQDQEKKKEPEMVKKSTNPKADGSQAVSEYKKTNQDAKKQQQKNQNQKSQQLNNSVNGVTTAINNTNVTNTTKNADNGDKIVAGINSLIESSKPQVIYIWPSDQNSTPKIQTFVKV